MQKSSKQSTPDLPLQLLAEVASQSSRVVAPEFTLLARELQSRFGEALDAVILYGSCLHTHNPSEGVVDLYAIVDDYRNAYGKRHLRILNAWLPPNVFYMEVGGEEAVLRCKYAVLSRHDFERGCRDWFHSYIWARFAQPVRTLYTRDEVTLHRVNRSLAEAVITFLQTTIPMLGSRNVNAEEIWTRGLALTYAAELRPEKRGRERKLTHLNLGDYSRLTGAAVPAMEGRLQAEPEGDFRCMVDKREQRRCGRKWWLRRQQGRILSVARLVKAVFTFNHCIEYAAWKIKRHTGVTIEITPRLRRHPILFGSSILWQLLRRGVLR
ncbi:MAG: hypothetical protein WD750_11775 [Gammaproteobacteria bacterium]